MRSHMRRVLRTSCRSLAVDSSRASAQRWRSASHTHSAALRPVAAALPSSYRSFQTSSLRLQGDGKPAPPLDAEDAHAAETENAAANEYLGVTFNATKVKKYSAELEIEGHMISGGDYWTALDAAKAYDELVGLYCDLDAPRNFPSGSAEAEENEAGLSVSDSEWEVPEVGKRNADIIPPIPQTYLTLTEVTEALEREKAIDVYTVDLAGKSSLADYMVFTTGRSQAHMRRMADLLIKSMKAREFNDDFEYAVEGRDCDDWMIADCNNIVVHMMRADTRRILALEDHWENMVNDKHRVYGDMSEDEYMDKFGTSELMEYLEDEDHPHADSEDKEGSGVEWK